MTKRVHCRVVQSVSLESKTVMQPCSESAIESDAVAEGEPYPARWSRRISEQLPCGMVFDVFA
jgi:hypothetical protein